MSISFVAADGTSNTSTGTTYTVNKPSGTDVGDLMIAASFMSTTLSEMGVPSGWSVAPDGLFASAIGADVNANVFFRVFQAGDPTSWTGSAPSAATGTVTITSTYRGVDQNSPFLGGMYNMTNNTTALTAGTIYNVNSRAWAIGFSASLSNQTVPVYNSGDPATSRNSQSANAIDDVAIGCWDSDGPVSTGDRTFATTSTGVDGNWAWLGILAPAPGPVGYPVVVQNQAINRASFW
jgi:hypothetical protein